MLAVNCELVMMLPLAWAIVLVRDESSLSQRRMLGVGVLIGIASLVKYQAVLWVPVIMAAIAVAAREAASPLSSAPSSSPSPAY